MNAFTIPSFMISLILLVAVTEERDRCAFFIVKKRTATLNLCSHHTTPNAVLLSLLNLRKGSLCELKSRYTKLDSVVIWETKSTTSLRQTWRKRKLEFLRQPTLPLPVLLTTCWHVLVGILLFPGAHVLH